MIRQAVSDEAGIARLCELNVIEQVRNVCQTTIVQDAWRRGQSSSVHGWIYDVRDGLLRDLRCTTTSAEEVAVAYARAIESAGFGAPGTERMIL